MASFNGATFRFRGSGGRTFPIWDKRDILAIKQRPNDAPVVQEIGMDVQKLALVVRCTKAELIALYDQVLESGSLIVAWETHNAFLESIDGVFQVVTGQDVYEATLNTIRL